MKINYTRVKKDKIVLILGWERDFTGAISEAFKKYGFVTVAKPGPDSFLNGEKFKKDEMAGAFKEIGADIVFTFNYYIFISEVCQMAGIPYFSWLIDSPWTSVFNKSVLNSCNRIFIFDSHIYELASTLENNTIHYLPLATNPDIIPCDTFPEPGQMMDISFVGAMYTQKDEDKVLDRILAKCSEDTRGYFDGLLSCQSRILDNYFLYDCMEDDVIMDVFNTDIENGRLFWNDEKVTKIDIIAAKYDVSQSALGRKMTSLDRIDMLEEVGRRFGLVLYCGDKSYSPEGIDSRGSVKYGADAAKVFRNTRINLNISLRSIHTGIPLRVFDIMGAGGFVLSDYQQDFEGIFEPGVDLDYFHSKEEMLDKIDFYLRHEDLRAKIARTGYEKVCREHTYEKRIKKMLSYL